MNLGQFRGELPEDRDSRLVGAMIIGGMRRTARIAVSIRSDGSLGIHTDWASG